MICFVTDIRAHGEADILMPLRGERLVVRSLDGQVITKVEAPPAGWTHEALVAEALRLEGLTSDGAEAYLGGVWVGSTEV